MTTSSMRPKLSPQQEDEEGCYGAAKLRRARMRWMTGEKGLVCCMARLESAPGTRDMLALHEALVALRGANPNPKITFSLAAQ
jgi:hypothetical protein